MGIHRFKDAEPSTTKRSHTAEPGESATFFDLFGMLKFMDKLNIDTKDDVLANVSPFENGLKKIQEVLNLLKLVTKTQAKKNLAGNTVIGSGT